MLWWWTHSQGVSRSCCQIAFRVLTGVSLLLEQYWLYLRLVLLFWFHFLSHTLFNIYNTFQVVTIVKVYTEENDSCIVSLVWLTSVCSSICTNIITSKLELVSSTLQDHAENMISIRLKVLDHWWNETEYVGVCVWLNFKLNLHTFSCMFCEKYLKICNFLFNNRLETFQL